MVVWVSLLEYIICALSRDVLGLSGISPPSVYPQLTVPYQYYEGLDPQKCCRYQ